MQVPLWDLMDCIEVTICPTRRWSAGDRVGCELDLTPGVTTGEKSGCHAPSVSEKDMAMKEGRWE